MKQALVFIHPTLFKRIEVHVGPDLWMFVVGASAAMVRLFDVCSGAEFAWTGYAAAAALAHARHWRHAWTLPALGSFALALMSFGMSACISGGVINRLVAQSLRDAGWKIRNTDGELGEYSSRFLAVDRLGFHDSDLMGMASAYVAHEPNFPPAAEQASQAWQDTVPQTRAKVPGAPILHDVNRIRESAEPSHPREAQAAAG